MHQHAAGMRHVAERELFKVARREATSIVRTLGLDADDADELVARWMRTNLGPFIAAGTSLRGPRRATNTLLAYLKRGLRSRGIDLWRALYAKDNRLAQYFYVRFGKALRRSATLMETGGYVTLRQRSRLPPGDPELIRPELIAHRPAAPIMRSERLRSPRGMEHQYERWMEECIVLAGGKLKRRILAELLAQAHGESPRRPGRWTLMLDAAMFAGTTVQPVEADESDPQGNADA